MTREHGETPWVKVPANRVRRGARLWTHEGEPFATFVKVERSVSGSMMRSGSWWLVYVGALSGAELRLHLEGGPATPIKIVREDAH